MTRGAFSKVDDDDQQSSPTGAGLQLIRRTLDRTRIFARWSDDELTELARECRIVRFGDRQHVCRLGDSVHGFWLVIHGTVEASRTWANGRRLVHEFLMPGQVGALAANTVDGIYSLDLVSHGATTLAYVPWPAFKARLDARPELLWDLTGMFARRMRINDLRMQMLALNSMRVRLAQTLLYLARGQAAAGFGHNEPTTALSQDNVAALLGVSRQSISPQFKALAEEGIIQTGYRGITVRDFPGLIRVANEEEPLCEIGVSTLFDRPEQFHAASD